METTVQSIPESLIYEMVDGTPIYYKGYKEYLNGTKQWDEIMGSSKLQARLSAELIFLLKTFLSDAYLVFSNELGLQFSKGSWRAADIAMIKANKVKQLDDKYLNVAPELVIEIDTKKAWSLTDWTEDLEILEGLHINLQHILNQKKLS